ncbi:MAG TPA: hypothetical protein ENK53_07725, partial [Thiotrichales bacterium]|nr:hypothetical protein [Thiotrichales bacterium]
MLAIEDSNILDDLPGADFDLAVSLRRNEPNNPCGKVPFTPSWAICSIRDLAVYRSVQFTYKPPPDCPGFCFTVSAGDAPAWSCAAEPNGGPLLSILVDGQEGYAFEYNAIGQITRLTDPLGRTWTYHYDGLGRVTEVIDPAPYAQQSQRFEYEWLSHPARLRVTVTDRRGKQWKYVFDAHGRLIKTRNPLGQTRSYAYDDDWNLTTFTDERGKTWSATYDDRGNMLALTDP